jgi:Tfp pilus assembly protein PilO
MDNNQFHQLLRAIVSVENAIGGIQTPSDTSAQLNELRAELKKMNSTLDMILRELPNRE